jgi:hypothetical protein
MPRDPQRVARTTALTIVNAMLFQQVLSRYDRRVPALPALVERDNVAERLSAAWQRILTEIDYIPIFQLARDLVLQLTGTPGIDLALRDLAQAAQRITARQAALRHDLMGRIFHQFLTDRKYFGAFYTTVPAATLLLKLALDPSQMRVNWKDIDAIKRLRIADLASGTGTLLKAALHTVVDNHVRAAAENGEAPKLDDVHRVLVEDVLWGLDVVPFAIHLAATALALHDPEVRFATMNLVTLPLGAPTHATRRRRPAAARARIRLGSIDLFLSRRIAIQADLFGAAAAGPTRRTPVVTTQEEVEVPTLDLCVMNPPFTRSVGGNLLFGNRPEAERAEMQRDLRSMMARLNVPANVTAGLGSVFGALGHRLLNPGGQLALVLPRAILSGIAWAPTRELLARDYHVRSIVVSHEPGAWNFSENTDLSECLLVARRLAEGEVAGPTKVINLWRRPRNSIEALAVAHQLASVPGASLTGTGIDEVVLGGEKIAEVVLVEPGRITAGRFNEGSAFAQTDLCRIARALQDGRLYLPGRGQVAAIPMVTLDNVAEIGPDRRDVHDGFQLSPGVTAYPTLWGHETGAMRCLAEEPNAYLAPLPRARPGRPLRPVTLLWPRAGRLMMAERLRLNTARVVCVQLGRRALSNMWWPLTFTHGTADERRESEQILALWLNSTLGLIMLMAARVDTEGPWIQLKKPILSALQVLDAARLTERQRAQLVRLYNYVKDGELGRIPEIADDAVRAQIDAGLMHALGIDANLREVRDLVASEPLLRPAPAETPVVEPAPVTIAEHPEPIPVTAPTRPRRPLSHAPGRGQGQRPTRVARGRAR